MYFGHSLWVLEFIITFMFYHWIAYEVRLTPSSTKVKFVQPWLIKYAPSVNRRYPASTLMYKDRRNRITHFLTQHHTYQPPAATAREGGHMAHPFDLYLLPRASTSVSSQPCLTWLSPSTPSPVHPQPAAHRVQWRAEEAPDCHLPLPRWSGCVLRQERLQKWKYCG